jgi:CTP synthase (UTP-ammonia lyase)
LKIADADTEENNSGSAHLVITPLSCALPNRREGGPKASGDEHVEILPGTTLHKICGSRDYSEQYYCNYGVNEGYEQQFTAAGLRICARGMHGETRAVELPGHRFFIATLFQPQLSSRPEHPHPIVIAFLRAALGFKRQRGQRRGRKPGGRHSSSRR